MIADMALDVVLAALVVAVAFWTVATRDGFAAVIGSVAYGLLLALAWVRVAAVDVALTEAAIGSLTGVVLLAAIPRRERAGPAPAETPGRLVRIGAGVLCAAVSAGLAGLVLLPPGPAPTLAPAAVAALPATALGNPVAAVLIVYRAVDTLLESVVLLLALLGVWSLAPDRFWGGLPGRAAVTDRDPAIVFMARVLPPVGIVVGIHIVWVGASAPGGKFQGATILAAMWVLAVMAGLAGWPAIGRARLRLALIVGPAVFLAIGLAGFAVAGGFLSYPAGFVKPLILVIEAALTLSVAVTLGLLVAGAPRRAAPE